MANLINVTACDNELIFIAYQWGVSYEVFRVHSGNSNLVTVDLQINAGSTFSAPDTLNGVYGPLTGSYTSILPSGTYSLVAIGVNWGGPYSFSFSFNGETYTCTPGENEVGDIWRITPVTFTV